MKKLIIILNAAILLYSCKQDVVTDYGSAITSVSSFVGFFEKNSNGEDVYYGTTRSGEYCRLFRYNVTRDIIDLVVNLDKAQGAWAIYKTGNNIYVGTYFPALIYKYNLDTRILKTISNLDKERFIWCVERIGDKLYWGTYPNGGLYEMSLNNDKFIRPIHRAKNRQYINHLKYLDGELYISSGTPASLVKYDTETKESIEILPEEYLQNSFISDLDGKDSLLFISFFPGKEIVAFNVRNGEFIELTNNWQKLPCYSDELEKMHDSTKTIDFTLLTSSIVFRYLPDHDELYRLTPYLPYMNNHLSGAHITADEKHIAGITFNGKYIETTFCGKLKKEIPLWKKGLKKVPAIPFSILIHDGLVYSGELFLQSYNYMTGEKHQHEIFGEAKTLCIIDSFLYMAVYTGASLWRIPLVEINEGQDKDFKDSAKYMLLEVGHRQNRPLYMVNNDIGHIFLSTGPVYGDYGGVLTIYDTRCGRYEIIAAPLSDHLISQIMVSKEDSSLLYMTLTPKGALGAKNSKGPAHLICYNYYSDSLIYDIIPDESSVQIWSSASNVENIFLVGSDRKIVVVEKQTGRIIKKKKTDEIIKLYWADGELYGINYKSFYKIDEKSLETELIQDGFLYLHDIKCEDGAKSLFLIDKTRLLKYDLN